MPAPGARTKYPELPDADEQLRVWRKCVRAQGEARTGEICGLPDAGFLVVTEAAGFSLEAEMNGQVGVEVGCATADVPLAVIRLKAGGGQAQREPATRPGGGRNGLCMPAERRDSRSNQEGRRTQEMPHCLDPTVHWVTVSGTGCARVTPVDAPVAVKLIVYLPGGVL